MSQSDFISTVQGECAEFVGRAGAQFAPADFSFSEQHRKIKVLRVLFAISAISFGLVHLAFSLFFHWLEPRSALSYHGTPNNFGSDFLSLLDIILIVEAGFAIAARCTAVLIVAAIANLDAILVLGFWFFH